MNQIEWIDPPAPEGFSVINQPTTGTFSVRLDNNFEFKPSEKKMPDNDAVSKSTVTNMPFIDAKGKDVVVVGA